jgi:hypothetical protein
MKSNDCLGGGLLAACLLLASPAYSQAQDTSRAWIEESNRHAQVLLDVYAQHSPEQAASIGVDGLDDRITVYTAGYDERFETDLLAAAARLEAERGRAADPRVQQDLDIMIQSAREFAASMALSRRLMLPTFDVPEQLFSSFSALLDPRIPKERYPAALKRLAGYVGSAPGAVPLTELAKARTSERFASPGLTGPWKAEVEQSLENSPRYVAGMRELFKTSGLKGWERDFGKLEKQIADYDAWRRSELLPRARLDNILPPEIYADNLHNFGVKDDPSAVMQRAQTAFIAIRDEMDAVAREIARQRGWPSADYRDVIRKLKQETIPNDQLVERYRARLASLEEIVRRENLIAMPERAAVIRLGTEAESARTPAPHVSPPRLIGNTGEPAEFVLPLENPSAKPGTVMDDFNYDAITWSLTAHEARPGHELQFAKMTENGVSTARAVFAFNSANVEGWALYAEAVMKQFYPLEGQLGALQFRLMRAARAFLDPMLNLGLIKPEQALEFLQREVVLSGPMAEQEVDRYTFLAPGQATSYFYGYERLQALRTRVEIALGKGFDQRSFHDFVIGQGLLPLNLLEKAVLEQYLPARLQAASAAAAAAN